MKTSLSGGATSASTAPERASAKLVEERLRADFGLEHERALLDAALEELDQQPGSEAYERGSIRAGPESQKQVKDAVRNRLRAKRWQFDTERDRDRVATDDALRIERSSATPTQSQNVELALEHLGAIAEALAAIKIETFDRACDGPIFRRACDAEVALERVIDLLYEPFES